MNKDMAQAEIKKVCKDLLRKWHPDKFLVIKLYLLFITIRIFKSLIF